MTADNFSLNQEERKMVERTLGKKAQLGLEQLPQIILGFIVIVVVLSIAAVTVTNVRDTGADYTTVALSTNESYTGTTSLVTLAHDGIIGGSEKVYNITQSPSPLRTSDYIITYNAIKCVNATTCIGAMNITYSWRYYGASWNASKYGLAGITTFSENMPTIAIIIIMGLILVILFGVFASTLKNR